MLEKVGLDLDSCRMLLAKPTEDYNRGLGEQYKNMNLVKKSFDDAVSGDRLRSFQVATDCNKIMLEDATACPFDKLCARILSCTIVSNPSLTPLLSFSLLDPVFENEVSTFQCLSRCEVTLMQCRVLLPHRDWQK